MLLWVLTPCRPVRRCQSFGETYSKTLVPTWRRNPEQHRINIVQVMYDELDSFCEEDGCGCNNCETSEFCYNFLVFSYQTNQVRTREVNRVCGLPCRLPSSPTAARRAPGDRRGTPHGSWTQPTRPRWRWCGPHLGGKALQQHSVITDNYNLLPRGDRLYANPIFGRTALKKH
jgi:hypothetical protein